MAKTQFLQGSAGGVNVCKVPINSIYGFNGSKVQINDCKVPMNGCKVLMNVRC